MFSSCVRCRSDLGRNHSLAHLPVGQRIAYELVHGRLWVICRHCGAWNLTPIEDRWEALEECEQLFQAAPARSSASTIGLAQGGPDLELVRIGPATTRSDIANCRYGARMHRRRGWFLYGGAILLGISLAILTRLHFPTLHFTIEYPLVVAWSMAILAVWLISIGKFLSARRLGVRLRALTGSVRTPLSGLSQIKARRTGDRGHIGIVLPAQESSPMLVGAQASAYLAIVLPLLNWKAGSPRDIQDAITLVEQAEGPPVLHDDPHLASWERLLHGKKRVTLADLPTPSRLALEMAIEEARELEALQGRAIRLLPVWEEAEAVAAIADALLVPPAVQTWLARLQQKLGRLREPDV